MCRCGTRMWQHGLSMRAVCEVFISIDQQQPSFLWLNSELCFFQWGRTRHMKSGVRACTHDDWFLGVIPGVFWVFCDMYHEKNDSKYWQNWLLVNFECPLLVTLTLQPQLNNKKSTLSTFFLPLTEFTLLPPQLTEGLKVIFGAADAIEPDWTDNSFW